MPKLAFRTVKNGVHGRVTLRRVKGPWWIAAEKIAAKACRRYGGDVLSPRLGNIPEGWSGTVFGGDLDGTYVKIRPFEVSEDRAPWIMEAADRWTRPADGRPWVPYTLWASWGHPTRWLVRACAPYSGNLNLPAVGYGGPIEFERHEDAKAFIDRLNTANGF